MKTKIYSFGLVVILLPPHPHIGTTFGFDCKSFLFGLWEPNRFSFELPASPLSYCNFTTSLYDSWVIPHLTLPSLLPRLQGHWLLQRAVWLPVAHITFLGWPSGAASAGGPAGSAGAHGQWGEGQPAMSDPWFHCRGTGGVAARTTGKKSIYKVRVWSWSYGFVSVKGI